ncbi:glycine cleavage system aminomethyltransferase GcvT [Ferruginivarius sediminum]|uniref:aminomethyltransferase n=1 Tax=Ferruginivarius sediminum TaxID=2661937 RepID=A0A369TE35_9PROT|nr:glycine cleavage system aminomethyltransferase GcvT [Ferruginivarius sediminum]RDD63530.1 glycine cleavage system aminomethyltransferase GcvT [Ferruginivarius sediminum]
MADPSDVNLKHTPLHALHVELGAKMVPFAGYEMPVQYPSGIVTEHNHTRAHAGLFDVSHMGQAFLRAGTQAADKAIECLVPGDIQALKPGRLRYTLLLNAEGGIIDDFMVTRPADGGDDLFLVVNAARKDVDFATIADKLGGTAGLEPLTDRALFALQGPEAVQVLRRLAPDCAGMAFMSGAAMRIDGVDALVSRSGYTGEDGFEISVPATEAEGLCRKLLSQPEVKPIGLGARDTLRLEAGLCLYGHDLDETTTPVEAGLAWTIGKRRRETGDFPGAERILRELKDGPARKRVGLRPEGKAPVREDAGLVDPADGRAIGNVTSGGYGPTVGAPIAMGYVETAYAAPDTEVHAMVRGKARPCRVVKPPFVEHGSKSTS